MTKATLIRSNLTWILHELGSDGEAEVVGRHPINPQKDM
jgi:hypothetical protein